MSAYNVLVANCACPNCGKSEKFFVQFKYGNTWQLNYRIGDKITWGGNDIGSPNARRIRIEGIGGPCTYCGLDNIEFDIFTQLDEIVEVKVVGIERENALPDGFEIIEQ